MRPALPVALAPGRPQRRYTFHVDTHGRRAVLGLVLAFGALLALAFGVAGCEDSPPEALGPGIWVAAVQAATLPPQPGLVAAPVRVFDAVSGTERQFGPPSAYILVNWSPDGRHLAALGLDESDKGPAPHFRIWNARGGVVLDRSYGDLVDFPSQLDWSPDGSRLAATTSRGVAMLDSSGREVGSATSTPRADGSSGISRLQWVSPWSPDSGHFVVPMNGLLLVVDREGHGGEYEFPAIEPARSQGILFDGWRGPGKLGALALGAEGAATAHEGVLQPSRIDWDAGQPVDRSKQLPSEQRVASFAQLLPGLEYSAERRSADGSAAVVSLAGHGGDPRMPVPLAIAIELTAQTVVIDLGPTNPRTPPVDVLIRPGWKGNVPDVVKAATPLPTPGPTRTEVSRPTPSLLSTPYPDTGPPYPTPRGERVLPQVSGLPLYPGSHEIDGFTRARPGITGNVQMYASPGLESEVLDFFQERLVPAGFAVGGGQGGPDGRSQSYSHGRDRVLISTRYIPRPGDEQPPGDVQYGFQGKGNRFIDQIGGERFFYVVTLRAPQP